MTGCPALRTLALPYLAGTEWIRSRATRLLITHSTQPQQQHALLLAAITFEVRFHSRKGRLWHCQQSIVRMVVQ